MSVHTCGHVQRIVSQPVGSEIGFLMWYRYASVELLACRTGSESALRVSGWGLVFQLRKVWFKSQGNPKPYPAESRLVQLQGRK
jgi:hypothetical protein